MSRRIKIKRGLDIPLEGEASSRVDVDTHSDLFGIVPDDYPGYTWKCAVKPGEHIEAGDPLLMDKTLGKIFLTSPVSGTVDEVRRGERRKILAVSVKREGEVKQVKYPEKITKENFVDALCRTGLWALMRQRPYDIVPSPEERPRDIFITAVDTAPLAPALFRAEDMELLQSGVSALASLTKGNVYITFRAGEALQLSDCEVIEIEGPHPAGNVGVQINHIRPVDKGDVVWTMSVDVVRRIGKFVKEGIVDYSAMVAVTGPKTINPHFVSTMVGASLKTVLEGFLPEDKDIRVISGNVLTGEKLKADEDFLRYPYRQVTIIKEGTKTEEFMGWASLNPMKYSVKRTFPAFLRGLSKPFPFDARIKGGHRAMILSGEYDKVFPMDIYPEYLIKAIIARDIDKMEQLGIYEVAPEDFALPEFVDTSKNELQKIVRDGLDYLRREI